MKPGAYNIRLISDHELAAISDVRFSEKDLISKSRCLDSAVFGAVDSRCSICKKTQCDGHMGLIKCPCPIPRALCTASIKQLLKIICPKCAHVVLAKEIKDKILKIPAFARYAAIREEVDKIVAKTNNSFVCPCCGENTSLIEINGNEPVMQYMIDKNVQLNPVAISTLFNLFTETELLGWGKDWHPKNFFTIYIPIVPNKLRLKLFDSTTSILGSYYKSIIEEIIPELTKVLRSMPSDNWLVIPNGELMNKFNQYYNQLNAYYFLITDPTTESVKEASLQLINKRDRKHVDPSNSILGRLKGKGKKLFSKGIIDSRHDCSARTVLGGAPDAKVIQVTVPKFIANKLSKLYPVYEQNIKTMRALVASMGDTSIYNNTEVPQVLKVHHHRTNTVRKIEPKNAAAEAALLMPGDKVEISLIDGDFVMQSRYPSVREESWSSLQVSRDDNSIVSIPLAICEMKMADFDGDEAQIFVSSSNNYSLEQLLLHSVYKQCIAYKDGNPAIFYTKDSSEGVPRIKKNKKSIISKWGPVYPLVDAFTEIEKVFPKNLNYSSSKLEIKNGKITEKSNFSDKEFYKYVSTFYGSSYMCNILDQVSQTAYDLNRNDGVSLGFSIRIFSPELRKEVQSTKAKLMKELLSNEQLNDPNKDVRQLVAIQKIQPELKAKLKKDIEGTELSSYSNRLEELYTMLVSAGQVVEEGGRIPMLLAEGSRTSAAYPRYSVDPCAYGYINRGYLEDPGAVDQLYNARSERHMLYAKGVSVGSQGYMQKRFCMLFGAFMVDFSGHVVDDRRLVALHYGSNGTDPRLHSKLPILYPDMSDKKYSRDKELAKMVKVVKEWNKRYGTFAHETTSNIVTETWSSGFDWNQFFKQNCKKGVTDDEIIDKLIGEMKAIFVPEQIRKGILADEDLSLINLYHHILYFRTILREYEIEDKDYELIIENFRRILCHGGEPAGIKAAIAASEPLTQSVLHAIHGHAGGVSLNRIVRNGGSSRFEELIGGATFTNNVITLGLYDDSKENTINYARNLETFYLSDILINSHINIIGSIDSFMYKEYPDISFDDLSVSEYSIQMVWNLAPIAPYYIHPTEVIDRLMENYEEILFCGAYILNSMEIKVHVYFKPDISMKQVFSIAEEWGARIRSTVIHGEYLINCFVSENLSNPGHYIIEANEVSDNIAALENMIWREEIDPSLCRSTNIDTMCDLFGICEGLAQLQAELTYAAHHLSDTAGVLQKHYNLMSHGLFVSGKFAGASRYSIRNDEYIDAMTKINFEDVRKGLTDAVISNKPEVAGGGYVSAYFFGELPPSGDGASKVILYEK